MRKMKIKEPNEPLYTMEDALETSDSLKSCLIRLFAREGITENQFKDRYLEFYTITENMSKKMAKDKYANDLRIFKGNPSVTYAKFSRLVLVVLRRTLTKISLELSDIDGDSVEEVTFHTHGF